MVGFCSGGLDWFCFCWGYWQHLHLQSFPPCHNKVPCNCFRLLSHLHILRVAGYSVLACQTINYTAVQESCVLGPVVAQSSYTLSFARKDLTVHNVQGRGLCLSFGHLYTGTASHKIRMSDVVLWCSQMQSCQLYVAVRAPEQGS